MSAVNAGGISLGTSAAMRVAIGPGAFLVSGWFRPTALTGSRVLWCFGDATQLALNSNGLGGLSLTINRGTTDRIVNTGYAIVANQWSFLCAVVTGQSTVSEDLWYGTETSIPTNGGLVVATAGSGNLINSNVFVVGVDSVGGQSFPGSFSQITTINLNQEINDISLSSSYLFNRFVYPLYTGTFDRQMLRSSFNGAGGVRVGDQGGDRFLPLDGIGSGATAFTFTESTTGAFGPQLPSQTDQTALSSSTYSSVEPSCGRMDRSIMNGFRLSPTLRR